MANSYSFDISSKLDQQELDNTINNTEKEITGRFDFRDTGTEIKLTKDGTQNKILINSIDEFKVKATVDVLISKAVKRGVDPRFFDFKNIEPAGNGRAKQEVIVKNGISQEDAKKVTKLIKDAGLKVQTQIQADEVRVSGKSKDDLQAVMTLLKGAKLDFPISFGNYR